jgi:hypothetical protein
MTAPICPLCGNPKQARETRGPNPSYYYRCAPCQNGRQRTMYAIRRSHGLSDTGVPLRSSVVIQPDPPAALMPPVLLPPMAREEKPRLRCWREKVDYWAAWKHLGARP